jgi:hypothetical protein
MNSTDVAQKTRFIDFTNNRTSRNSHINATETQYSNISSFDIQSFERRVFSRFSIANSFISRNQLIDSSAINRDFDESFRDLDDHWIDRDKFEFLWSDVVRRSVYKSSVAHERILSVLKSFLIVDIVSDFFESKKCATWSKRKKMWFSDVMQKNWTRVTRNVKIQERQMNDNVTDSSHSNETKRISSLTQSIRSMYDIKSSMMSSMIDDFTSLRAFKSWWASLFLEKITKQRRLDENIVSIFWKMMHSLVQKFVKYSMFNRILNVIILI